MSTEKNNPAVKSLQDLYKHLDLRVDLLQPSVGFTIHNLKDVGFDLPYQSPSFRPDYFCLLFVKDGAGQYTIDEYSFKTEPHSIYFTNPSNYRTFGWNKVEEVYLLTFDEALLKKYVIEESFEEFPFLLTESISPKVVSTDFFRSVEQIYLPIYQE